MHRALEGQAREILAGAAWLAGQAPAPQRPRVPPAGPPGHQPIGVVGAAPTSQKASLRREAYAVEEAVRLQARHLAQVGDGKQQDGAGGHADRQHWIRPRAQGNGENPSLFPLERAHRFQRGRTPERAAGGLVARREEEAVGREGHGRDGAARPGLHPLAPATHIPEDDGGVLPANKEALAIGAENKAGDLPAVLQRRRPTAGGEPHAHAETEDDVCPVARLRLPLRQLGGY
mmetsp:Transcript_117289/g.311992  ORF Transcript_117289/g.311992 Transcript_117289/m.311992 type:complete len:232 (-) Transcript_117289:17-712(-)